MVLSHHPLHWLRDSADTARFLRARATVFISGHTHSPSYRVHRDPLNGDIIFISAGAAVPPSTEAAYQFTYNKLTFVSNEDLDALTVQIEARTWNANATRFMADRDAIGIVTHILKCPGFRRAAAPKVRPATIANANSTPHSNSSTTTMTRSRKPPIPKNSELLRLRFFRDLTIQQRATVLAELNVLPAGDWVPNEMTHTLARRLLDTVLSQGRAEDLRRAMESVTK